MKYKLLKNLPNLEAGALFERVMASPGTWANFFGLRKIIEFKDEEVENNPDWFEPVIERWSARRNSEDRYFYVCDTGHLNDTVDYGTSDTARFDYGNYFRTKAQAEEASRRIKKVLMDYHAEIGE